ncbi:uncharacterized protein H6S33_001869 [Morchella sextelata]|uniref:uncharacterized protein n=1 Tax=Morchella sextelata TaxID=1174677 RepID=UPI001D041099|nr:uncharacterized protein H6S33_001869 [Morchella sextelata]KAH0608735.1 hypothetical protein H6S33_001869 [Morchella sextelata]
MFLPTALQFLHYLRLLSPPPPSPSPSTTAAAPLSPPPPQSLTCPHTLIVTRTEWYTHAYAATSPAEQVVIFDMEVVEVPMRLKKVQVQIEEGAEAVVVEELVEGRV